MFNIKTDYTLTNFLLNGLEKGFFADINEIIQAYNQKEYYKSENMMKLFQETWKHNIAIITSVGERNRTIITEINVSPME